MSLMGATPSDGFTEVKDQLPLDNLGSLQVLQFNSYRTSLSIGIITTAFALVIAANKTAI